MDTKNQKLALKDGRLLGYAQYGLQTGTPVFHFHGSASSRLERPSSEDILRKHDIRFISVDRPGHGLSDPQPGRRLLDWPGDILQLADHLDINHFYLTGHSAGGPHVLACAYQLPKQVKAAAVISGVAPMSRPGAYRGMPILNQILARTSRYLPWLTVLLRRMARDMVMRDPERATRQLMSSIPDSDKELLYDPRNVEIFVSSIREGFSQGYRWVAQDDILVNEAWGFALEDIKSRIDIWHGEADVNVPLHAGKYLGALIPNRRQMFLPDKGHFFIINRWEEILATLVDEN